MTIHKQIKVIYRNEWIEVDEGMKDILEAIWARGIHTCNSCQENKPGIAWIEFLTAYDAEQFCNLVYRYIATRLMKCRIEGYYRLDGKEDHSWEYDAHPNYVDWQDEIVFSISIRMPISDLKKITNKLKTKDLK